MLKNIETEKALGWIQDCLAAMGSPDEGPITERMRIWWSQGVFVSLREPGAKAFRDLTTLIEKDGKINDRHRAKDLFSRKYIEDKVQELIGQVVVSASESGVEASQLGMRAIREVWKRWLSGWDTPSDVITHYTLVQNLLLTQPLQIGTVGLRPWNDHAREALLSGADLVPPSDMFAPERAEELREWVTRDFPTEPGYALAQASIAGAEPLRAQEIFRERVREVLHALSFFRRFVWPVSDRVVLDLRGNVPPSGEAVLTMTQDHRWGASYRRATLPFTLGADRLETISAIGLSTLSQVLAKPEEQRTPLEASCINAVTWLSRGLQDDVPDSRLLKLCIGMESLLLARGDEVKGTTIADRVAFLLAKTSEARKAVAKEVLAIYAVRSDIAHEGRSSRLAGQLGPAQFYTTEAVLQFIRTMSQKGWGCQEDFIRWCNDLKWA